MIYDFKAISKEIDSQLESLKGSERLSRKEIESWIQGAVKTVQKTELNPKSFELFTDACYESCKIKEGSFNKEQLFQILPLMVWVIANTINEIGKKENN